MAGPAPLPVLLIGAGQRARHTWAALLRGPLADRVRLVGVVGRGRAALDDVARSLQVPVDDLLERSVARSRPAGVIVAVSASENGRVARQVIELGLPALLETPLALHADDASSLARLAARAGLPWHVAEQNPRHAGPALAREVARAGRVGEVRVVSGVLPTYRYHATAVARSLLRRRPGLDAVALRTRVAGPHPFVVAGTVSVRGALAQLSDAEAIFGGPWRPGAWWIHGDAGSFGPEGLWRHGRLEPVTVGAEGRSVGGVRWRPALPGVHDDLQAAAGCLMDWIQVVRGGDPWSVPDAWTASDAAADLAWIAALEASACLGGRRIRLPEPARFEV